MSVIATATTVGTHLFGGEANTYYADRGMRLIVVDVQANRHGEYRVVAYTGRWIAARNETVKDRVVFDSGVLASEAGARSVANDIMSAAPYFTGTLEPLNGQANPNLIYGHSMPGSKSVTHCPDCDRYNSLTTERGAWADYTNCTGEGCSYSTDYRLGD